MLNLIFNSSETNTLDDLETRTGHTSEDGLYCRVLVYTRDLIFAPILLTITRPGNNADN